MSPLVWGCVTWDCNLKSFLNKKPFEQAEKASGNSTSYIFWHPGANLNGESADNKTTVQWWLLD
jgi:hypothetical protein